MVKVHARAHISLCRRYDGSSSRHASAHGTADGDAAGPRRSDGNASWHEAATSWNERYVISGLVLKVVMSSDRPILIFVFTDYLNVYVPDMQNRYLFTVIK